MGNIIAEIKNKNGLFHSDGVTSSSVKDAECALSLTFSAEYIEYLSTFGVASFDGHELTGVCDFPRLNVVNATTFEKSLNEQIPAELYVIEQANIDGIVIWQSVDGSIYQSSPNTKPVKICNSLCEYITTY